MKSAAAAILMCLGLASAPALAQTVTDCRPHDPVQEAADSDLIDKAVPLMQAHDLDGLAALRPGIDAALGRAPDIATIPEMCGNTVVIYSSDTRTFLIARAQIARDPRFKGLSIQLRPDLPYARLGFVAGWIAYEQGDFEAAAKGYEKGLKNDPADPNLASEYSNALSRAGRPADALTFTEAYIAANPGLAPDQIAQMLRRKGYALTELERYDDALAAYDESLRFDPASPVAASEIAYINRKKTLRN